MVNPIRSRAELGIHLCRCSEEPWRFQVNGALRRPGLRTDPLLRSPAKFLPPPREQATTSLPTPAERVTRWCRGRLVCVDRHEFRPGSCDCERVFLVKDLFEIGRARDCMVMAGAWVPRGLRVSGSWVSGRSAGRLRQRCSTVLHSQPNTAEGNPLGEGFWQVPGLPETWEMKN